VGVHLADERNPAREIAERSEDGETSELGDLNKGRVLAPGRAPMLACRQTLPGEFRVGGRLVPADARNRIIVLSLGKVPRLPCGRAGLTGLVHESFDGFFPGQLSSVNFPTAVSAPWTRTMPRGMLPLLSSVHMSLLAERISCSPGSMPQVNAAAWTVS